MRNYAQRNTLPAGLRAPHSDVTIAMMTICDEKRRYRLLNT